MNSDVSLSVSFYTDAPKEVSAKDNFRNILQKIKLSRWIDTWALPSLVSFLMFKAFDWPL